MLKEAAAAQMRAPSSAVSLLCLRSMDVKEVRIASALQSWDTSEEQKDVLQKLRRVMVVRCINAGNSALNPPRPTWVSKRLKLVMIVFADKAGERI